MNFKTSVECEIIGQTTDTRILWPLKSKSVVTVLSHCQTVHYCNVEEDNLGFKSIAILPTFVQSTDTRKPWQLQSKLVVTVILHCDTFHQCNVEEHNLRLKLIAMLLIFLESKFPNFTFLSLFMQIFPNA